MPQIKEIKVKKGSSDLNADAVDSEITYMEHEFHLISDTSTVNQFLRWIVIHEKKLNRVILKVYLKLPDNLFADFERKVTVEYKSLLDDAMANSGGDSVEKRKKQDALVSDLLKQPDSSLLSTFYFKIKQRSIQDSGNYHTTSLRFYLPRVNHNVEIAFTAENDKVQKQLEENNELFADLQSYFFK